MAQNRLSQEKSPYLRQHASNPVDWFPWGKEAFTKAANENKPVFLSIGYATCHWCHVMERESFEDETVAALMNELFVSVKVDREERPDVDKLYMKACQMMTGRAGWPLTIIMTPDKKPFFAGTYIPKKRRFNQLGMLELIPRIGELWRGKKSDLLISADKILDALKQKPAARATGQIGENTLHAAYLELVQSFDKRQGGFGGAPKFPSPHTLFFLLRYWRRKKIPFALEMVEKTLRSMRLGGIFDHVGFGFHRYATDSHWRVPHFEKMLYDQALLAMAFTEAYQATKKAAYKQNAEEIFTYVFRDLLAPDGGFYSAEDADSEGEEGKFYTWTWDQLSSVLDQEELELAAKLFHAAKEGNFADESSGERKGANVLFRTLTLEEFTAKENLEADILRGKIDGLLRKLIASRQKRKRPLRDTKLLTDWNGLIIAALAKAGRAFSQPDLTESAARAALFLLEKLRNKDGELLHTYCGGESKTAGFADDYAFLVWGLTELYEATFKADYLETALELNQIFIDRFWDEDHGGVYFTSSSAESLFLRTKESFDGAVPSSNSVAMLNFLRLSRMSADAGLEEKAIKIGQYFARNAAASPSAHTMMLCAADFALGPGYEVVVAGKTGAADTTRMVRFLREEFIPNMVVLFLPAREKEASIKKIAPFAASYRSIEGTATAYVCSHHTCQKPTADIAIMRRFLGVPD